MTGTDFAVQLPNRPVCLSQTSIATASTCYSFPNEALVRFAANKMAAVKLIDELREAFTECSICMVEYTSAPKMLLPCLHTFCLACIERHASCTRHDLPLMCPTCRTPVAVPDGGIAALPTNFFVNRLQGSLHDNQAACGEVCAAHASKPACFVCLSCNEAICAGCMLTAGHKHHDCVEIDEAAAIQKKVSPMTFLIYIECPIPKH